MRLVFAPFLLLVLACGHQAAVTPLTPTGAEVGVAKAIAPKLPAPTVTGVLAARMLPAQREAFTTARLTIEARTDPAATRPPVDVVLCMDTSGSMEGKAIDDARKAALRFVDALRPGDGFALVTFDSVATHVIPARRLYGSDLIDLRARIAKIEAKGTTDMASGMQAALEESQRIYDPTRTSRIVLLGDGVANDAGPIKGLAQAAAARGTSITTVGLGPDYDEVQMGEIAQLSGGRFRYAEDSTKVAGFFDEELARATQVSAREATLELTAGPGVVITQVIGQESSRVGNVVRVYLGDLSAGQRRELFVKVKAAGHRDGASVELFDAVLRYTADGVVHTERTFLGAHATAEADKVAAGKDETIDSAAALAQQAADKLEAIKRAHDSDKTRSASGAGGASPPPPLGVHLPKPTAPMPAPASRDEQNLATKREHAAAMRALFD